MGCEPMTNSSEEEILNLPGGSAISRVCAHSHPSLFWGLTVTRYIFFYQSWDKWGFVAGSLARSGEAALRRPWDWGRVQIALGPPSKAQRQEWGQRSQDRSTDVLAGAHPLNSNTF